MRELPRPLTAAACLAIVGLLLLVPTEAETAPAPPVPGFGPSSTHINHVVIVMMENHAFDNLFGTYCHVKGPFCKTSVKGESPTLCVPLNVTNRSAGCISPYSLGVGGMLTGDLPHDWSSTHRSINHGGMNGFYQAEAVGALPFGYFNGSTIPLEWDLAEEYALGDHFFASTASYSLPNHWDLVAGNTPANSVNLSKPWNGHNAPAYRHVYLDSANTTPSIENLLNASPSVSWKYYDWSLSNYSHAISGLWGNIGAYNYWNPLAAAAQSYTAPFVHHFVNRTEFFSNAAKGTLPQISWVIPGAAFSDHPQLGNLSKGESFLSQTIDAVESSPEWNSTAIFVTWDEYGGWYDGVAPPTIDSLGLGIRVPLLVISPYTPLGKVVHKLGYFESLLHFVEWRFHLGCLTTRDCSAPLPFSYFNFNETARAPILFPTFYTNASYPMPLQTQFATGIPCPTNCAITPDAWVTPPAKGIFEPGVDPS